MSAQEALDFVGELYKKKILPSKLTPWREYYLLQLGRRPYPREFSKEDAERAVNLARENGLTHRSFIEWVGEHIRRKSKPLFMLPLAVEYNGEISILNVPIVSARDFGSMSECAACAFRLEHSTPADLSFSKVKIIAAPSVTMQLRRGMRKTELTFQPFEVEEKDTRVAELAFGDGVKDKEIEILGWKIGNASNFSANSAKQESPLAGCLILIFLALAIAFGISRCGNNSSDTSKDAPEASAPATTPPTNETP